MHRRERRTGWRTSRQLVLLVVVVVATACGRSVATTDSTGPLTGLDARAAAVSSARASDTPLPIVPTSGATTGSPAPGPTTATGAPATTGITDAAAPTDATGPSGATPMGAATPVRLQIPAIGVDSDLMGLGLQEDGTLEVPPTGFPAGWYRGAPTPGELGPAIIAGHVDWAGRPGVFVDLGALAPGDEIAVARADGSVARFHVDRVERFAKDQFPTAQVYADIDHAGLRLITCGGEFDRSARSYVDNLVVFASLVDQDPER